MDVFAWQFATVCIVGLLVLLAVRALRELLGIDARGYLSPAKWPRPVLAVAALILLWGGVIFGYYMLNGSLSGFFQRFYSHYSTDGDAIHYMYIAENGYARSGEEINKIVFYPLYPLLIAILRTVTRIKQTALLGMIVSQVCYGASVVVFAELAKRECKHPGTAIAAYVLYPFGFFCLGVFTEGLFLFLMLLEMLLIQRRKWLGVGIVGVLCGLTRTQGVLMFMPAVYCALRDIREERKWRWRYLAALGPLLGFGIYLVVNKVVCGEFFAYLYYQSINPWWQKAQWVGTTVVHQIHKIQEASTFVPTIYAPQLALFFIGCALLYLGFRKRMRTEHLLYGTAYLGMCYTPSWLLSGGRYMYGCIPMYFSVGSIDNRVIRAIILLAEYLLFFQFAYMFYQRIGIV